MPFAAVFVPGVFGLILFKVQARLRFAAAVLVACLLIAGDPRPAGAVTPPGEYQVKAAFLANFADFVRWPPAAFADAAAPFVICVAGDDPFGAAFEPFKARKIQGRSLVVQPVVSTAIVPKSCHLLFVARSETPRLDGILGGLGRAAVLTVSDLEEFAAAGGMIQFFIRDQKVRFEINRAAAEAVGLKIDARLLKLSGPARAAAPEARR